MNNNTKLANLLPIAFAITMALSPLAAQSAFAMNHTAKHTQESMVAMNPQKAMTVLGTTSTFKGVEVNGGTATLSKKDGQFRLKVSSDFKLPTSPAPHWQVVDGKGNTFLLQQFNIAGDKKNREIVLPKYITSVSKVQVWCSFAEVNLGEASFAKVMNLR